MFSKTLENIFKDKPVAVYIVFFDLELKKYY